MNIRTCRSDNKLGVRGISMNRNSFKAQITLNGKISQKTFKTLEEAILWRQQKEIELFGEFRPQQTSNSL